MKTFNKFLEEVKPEPPEPPQEDPAMKSKEKRQMQIKKQVLLKKMQAVRAGAGSDIVASHTPEGELVEGKVKKNEEKSKGRHPRDQKELERAQEFIKKNPNFGKVSEGTDKAFEYVKKQIAAKYGKSGYVSKDNPRKPQTAAEKKKVAAHKAKLAKQDHRDPTEKASDGRYSDRYSNRGSD